VISTQNHSIFNPMASALPKLNDLQLNLTQRDRSNRSVITSIKFLSILLLSCG